MNKPQELEENQVIPVDFRKQHGGDGFDGDRGNWLQGIPEGGVFLCRDRRDAHNPVLLEYTVVKKRSRAIELCSNIKEDQFVWVDPVLWCNKYEIIDLIIPK